MKTKKKSQKISRRDFNKKLAFIGAAGLASQLPKTSKAEPISDEIKLNGTSKRVFDYIVIGSGAGGGPVAANLAKAGFKVCLLEAGGVRENQNYSAPAMHAMATEDPNLAWSFYVNHYKDGRQQSLDSKVDRQTNKVLYPRGATLGGSTAVNAMITMYPDRDDWRKIQSITNQDSWHPYRMHKYYQRLENASYLKSNISFMHGAENDYRIQELRGFEGWLNLEQNDLRIALKDPQIRRIVWEAFRHEGLWNEIPQKLFLENPGIIDSLLSLQLPKLDPNMASYIIDKMQGIFNVPRATKAGRRNGTRELILNVMGDSRYSDNLHLEVNALVSRVMFEKNRDKDGKLVATSVKFFKGWGLYEADPRSVNPRMRANSMMYGEQEFFARREIIMSGGAFNSPQLLMLSGIGPASELEKVKASGRDVHQSLEGVGKNLQDRYELGIVSQLKSPFDVLKGCDPKQKEDPCYTAWIDNEVLAKGSENTVYGTNGVLASLIRKSDPVRKNPDLFIFAVPGDFRGYFKGWAEASFRVGKEKDYFTWVILKGHTANRGGEIKLKSANPFETPDINFNYFHEGTEDLSVLSPSYDNDLMKVKGLYPEKTLDEIDLDAVATGVKYVEEINAKMSDLIKSRIVPPPQLNLKDESQLKSFIKNEAWGHHASCSNKIGDDADKQAVLDWNFKVKGTANLRVVDASVFPEIPGLFIVVPVYMIAEKASDLILEEAREKKSRTGA